MNVWLELLGFVGWYLLTGLVWVGGFVAWIRRSGQTPPPRPYVAVWVVMWPLVVVLALWALVLGERRR